ncbi:zinc finger protein OZF-like [Palaemon carinicauda]|uniref:zinc finger protein OZF-like n=1 Tax=Palaemon carinicauda TaxID=392227 RepID=UPI0035B62147
MITLSVYVIYRVIVRHNYFFMTLLPTGGSGESTPGEVRLDPSRSIFLNAEIPNKDRIEISQETSKSLVEQPESLTGSKQCFQCDECGKEFTQRQALRYHKIWRHNGERLGPCPYCSYKAPDATKLKDHVKKVHHGFSPYKCKFCSKQFKSHSNHKEHEAKHQGTGSFKCKFCRKTFAISSSLERHERYHFSSRPYVCNYCEKSFKAKPHLKRHIHCIHLKEKNLLCKLCGKAHANNWNLKMHMKTHELSQKTIVRSCNICNCKFKNNTGLAAHMRKQHCVTSIFCEEPKLDTKILDTTAARDESGKPIAPAVAVSTCVSYDISDYSEGDCQAITSHNSSVEEEEGVPAHSTSEISEHRTIVIQDGSVCSDIPDIKGESTLVYADFLGDSSVHTFELYTCDICSSEFQCKDEFIKHDHIPQ